MELLKQYIEITKPISRTYLNTKGYAHKSTKHGPPPTARARKLGGEKAAAVKAQIKDLLDAGIIRPSSSKYASPIHMAQKKNNSWRTCGDYRKLNSIADPEQYNPLLIQDLFPRLANKKRFSKVDMQKAYLQLMMDDIEKTATITPWGLFEYLGMPFGLKNATQTSKIYCPHLQRS